MLHNETFSACVFFNWFGDVREFVKKEIASVKFTCILYTFNFKQTILNELIGAKEKKYISPQIFRDERMKKLKKIYKHRVM